MAFDDETKPFLSKFDREKKIFLHAVGNVGVNQAAGLTPVDTALSKNAKHYVISDGASSSFGNYPGKRESKKSLSNSDKGPTPPRQDSVSIYAPLAYDVWIEKKFKVMERTSQLVLPQILILGKKILGN